MWLTTPDRSRSRPTPGTVYTAAVVGTDPKTDLALIKVDGNKEFPFVKFAEHAPQVGDWVVAVGNPFGLGGTVTAGIVSARGRDIGAGPYDDYVQIDAPINKGNSGGPAFDVSGNVIGVNTAIFSPSGGSVGIGFDIPADTAKLVNSSSRTKDMSRVTGLACKIQPVSSDIADSLGLKKAAGAMVDEPQSGSPAAKAGIKSGDVIAAVNGVQVKDARELARTIGMMAPDSAVKLDIVRNGEPRTITATLAEVPSEQQAKADNGSAQPTSGVPHPGLQVAPAREVSGAGDEGCRGHRGRAGRSCGRTRFPERQHHPRSRRQARCQCRRRTQGAERSQVAGQAPSPDPL